MTSLQKTQWSD